PGGALCRSARHPDLGQPPLPPPPRPPPRPPRPPPRPPFLPPPPRLPPPLRDAIEPPISPGLDCARWSVAPRCSNFDCVRALVRRRALMTPQGACDRVAPAGGNDHAHGSRG